MFSETVVMFFVCVEFVELFMSVRLYYKGHTLAVCVCQESRWLTLLVYGSSLY
jgi:hypothetical protein